MDYPLLIVPYIIMDNPYIIHILIVYIYIYYVHLAIITVDGWMIPPQCSAIFSNRSTALRGELGIHRHLGTAIRNVPPLPGRVAGGDGKMLGERNGQMVKDDENSG